MSADIPLQAYLRDLADRLPTYLWCASAWAKVSDQFICPPGKDPADNLVEGIAALRTEIEWLKAANRSLESRLTDTRATLRFSGGDL